ncbi:hypothetical protein [Hyphobacterium sp.]|uniref:hypothetical protein n=1 Tax=Hyphobacterium sp. TaxID=2004662 RepID=UPI003BAD2A0B
MRASFVLLDRNVDEVVSINELAIAPGETGFAPGQEALEAAERRVTELDSDGDNQLSFREFMADTLGRSLRVIRESRRCDRAAFDVCKSTGFRLA